MHHRMCAHKGCEETFPASGKRKYCDQHGGKAYYRACAICGTMFGTSYARQVVCSSHECKKKHKANWERKRNKYEFPKERKCSVCQKPFIATKSNNHVCSDKECQRANKRKVDNRSKKRIKSGEPPVNTARMWDPEKFTDPYSAIAAPLSGLPGNHAAYHPLT